MERLQIIGERPLYGTVDISGMKNSAVAILIATVLVQDCCIIENVPKISDVEVTVEILRRMGAQVTWIAEDTLEIDTSAAELPQNCDLLVRKMRASYYLLGACLGRFGHCEMTYPGGCDFGTRPIDQHLKALSVLGATCECEQGRILLTVKEELLGGEISFDVISVGATINALLASACAKGKTVLKNAAREPHVQDLERFLVACGTQIDGVGESTVTVSGAMRLHGCRFRISDDMIEAGTYLIATAACGGDVCISMDDTQTLNALLSVLEGMGATVDQKKQVVRLRRSGTLYPIQVVTEAYPGFPTDLQPQIGVLMAITQGESRLYERVWKNRFQYVNELRKMGALVKTAGECATFLGTTLHGADVVAQDLRAGAAMLIAGLVANGRTTISNIYHIERGYTNIIEKVSSLGAQISKG